MPKGKSTKNTKQASARKCRFSTFTRDHADGSVEGILTCSNVYCPVADPKIVVVEGEAWRVANTIVSKNQSRTVLGRRSIARGNVGMLRNLVEGGCQAPESE